MPSGDSPLHVDATGLILVDEAPHLVRPRWREQQGVEAGVPLLLIDELGQVLLGHVGFGLGMVGSEDLVYFWPRTEAHEETLIDGFWEVLRIDGVILAFGEVAGTEGSLYSLAISRKHLEKILHRDLPFRVELHLELHQDLVQEGAAGGIGRQRVLHQSQYVLSPVLAHILFVGDKVVEGEVHHVRARHHSECLQQEIVVRKVHVEDIPELLALGHLGKLPKAGVPDAGDIQKLHLLTLMCPV